VKVVEQFIAGKSGVDSDLCEDAIVVTQHFAAVIDGATDKTGCLYGGVKGGRAAALAIASAVEDLPADIDAASAIAVLTAAMAPLAAVGPDDGPSAAVCIYSQARREVWQVGDVDYVLPGASMLRRPAKDVDQAAAFFRAAILATRLAAGDSEDELRANDPGREAIMPLLREQYRLRNRDVEFGYGAIDGRPVPNRFIRVERIPVTQGELVIFSDGYPFPAARLADAETLLHEAIQEDPLCIGRLLGTKAMQPGQVSFDDRAYLRLDVSLAE